MDSQTVDAQKDDESPPKQTSEYQKEPKTAEEEEEDDGSTASEEDEPKLKYVRMVNDLRSILAKDAASCIAVHPKLVCVGTVWGSLLVLDHQGNASRRIRAHSVAVTAVSVDGRGDFVASVSDDGRALVWELAGGVDQGTELGRLLRAVALEQDYGVTRRFITGDERLMLHERTFLSRLKSTVLCEAEGHVRAVRWEGNFVAWASDVGVRVYDIGERRSLGLIKWPRRPDASPEQFRCHLCWRDSSTLLIGWVDSVRICVVRRRTPNEMSGTRDLPAFVVEPVSMFSVDLLVCGLGPLGTHLVLLGVPPGRAEDGKAPRPHLRVVTPAGSSCDELSNTCLSLRGFPEYQPSDYHLECLAEENRFFIVSPKDIVVASPCDADDRIQWLVEHGKFEAALAAVVGASERELHRNSLLSVGRAYLDHLLASGDYDEAARLCLRVLGRDKRLWEEEVFKFARLQQLRAVSRYLPNNLDPHVYEMVLYEFLKTDPKGFLALVREWPPSLYNVAAVLSAVLEHLLVSDADKPLLLEALALLYTHQGKLDKALAMYLKLRHQGVFELARRPELTPALPDMASGLMELDSDRAVELLLERGRVSAEVVVGRLRNSPRYLYLYLDALDARGAARPYHGDMVRLYADFDRDKLLPFLRRSDQYPIQEALKICRERCYFPEMVYLLGRIGNTQEALSLITTELGDIQQAVAFCQEHDDSELWDDLIATSLNRPDFVTYLLQNVGTYIDPRRLVSRIAPGLPIPGLQRALGKMVRDYHLQVSVQEGCNKILVADCFNLLERLANLQGRGVSVDDEQLCGACQRSVIVKDPSRASNILVFYCRHAFHEDCLPGSREAGVCAICTSAPSK